MSVTTGDPYVDNLLVSNGLDSYISRFREHAIRTDVLSDLTDEDLLEIGVSSLGHRIRILKLANLGRSSSGQAPTAVSAGGPISSRRQNDTPSGPGDTHQPLTQRQLEESVASLKQQLEETNKQHAEQITKLRTWFSKKLKEMGPLPTPTGPSNRPKNISPGSTAPDSYFTQMAHNGHSSHALHKRPPGRSPQTAQFAQPSRSSPTTPLSPPVIPAQHRNSLVLPQFSKNGRLVLGTQNGPHNESLNVAFEERTPEVLATALMLKGVKDKSSWRLYFNCRAVGKYYELKDDQYPQRVFRDLAEQGLDPILVLDQMPIARQSQPNML